MTSDVESHFRFQGRAAHGCYLPSCIGLCKTRERTKFMLTTKGCNGVKVCPLRCNIVGINSACVGERANICLPPSTLDRSEFKALTDEGI
eukprot:2858574-Pyramimonas_sp.AAC.1